MYCPKCGTLNDDNSFRCIFCSEIIQNVPGQFRRYQADSELKWILPVGRSGWAIAAGYAALFSVLCFPAPLALILGIIAIIDIKRNPDKLGMGRAVFGIIMGAIFTILLFWIGIMLYIDRSVHSMY